jgi:hypothetical protein
MKWAAGDHLLRSILRKREAPLSNSNRVVSKFYFARSRKHLIDTTDMSRFAAKEITVIYLSFTNVRISIALPGGGVSLEGGTRGTYSGK